MGIQGQRKVKLTAEAVLNKISEYDIFKFYMADKTWKLNQVCLSPFRHEKHPSFMIGNKNGGVSFIDFTDTSLKGDCFTFVKMMYGLKTMDDVLVKIDSDFGLGFLSKNLDYKKIVSNYVQPTEQKRYSLIQVKTRKFTHEELAYWNEFYQDIEDLRKEEIFSIDKVYLNRQLFSLKETELRFGYYYDGHWKIYRPFETKQKKWVPNNVPITNLEGKDNIKNCKTALISKSKKDKMVLLKVFPHVCAVQNEGIACFSEENVSYIKDNSEKQILLFDSDIPGVTNSQTITKEFDFEYCNVPKIYLPDINDYAEFGRIHGLQKIEEQFKQKGIL